MTVANSERNDPYKNFNFLIEIDGIALAGFSECTGLRVEVEVIEYREGGDSSSVRKLPGQSKVSDITLKRGITDSLDIWNWHKEILAGQIQSNRKQVIIVVQDEAGSDKARFVVTEAWPTKYDPSDLNGKGNEVMIELLEFANEGIERVK